MPEKKKKKGDGPKINRDDIEEEYGLAYALFQAFPELEKLLNQAVKQNWTPTKFQVELRQTKWFEKHSDVWREMTALKYSDPATYKERLGDSKTLVKNLAGAFSARLGPKALDRLAERAMLLGWDEGQVRDQLAKFVRPSEGHFGGELSAVEQGLRGTAYNNGVRLGRDQMNRWMRAIVRGDASQDQFETYIRDIAAKTFGSYGDQIKAGVDMVDVASPYMQSMSEILEINPGQIDMFDPKIRRALSRKNEKGEFEPPSLTDFEDSLRQDKRWKFTQGAKDEALGFTRAISKMWGLG